MTYAMNASDMDPKWVEEMWAKFPCQKIVDANGQPNGNYRTGPVRGSFLNIFSRSKPVPPATQGKFTATALFPPAADISVLKQAATEAALSKWPQAGQVGGPSLHTPFRQQADKANIEGYTPGGVFIVGVTMVKGYEVERDVKMRLGDSVEVAPCHTIPESLNGGMFVRVDRRATRSRSLFLGPSEPRKIAAQTAGYKGEAAWLAKAK